MADDMHLPDRIESDAHRLFLELLADDTRQFLVVADTGEYADAVMNILEGLYPGAHERVGFNIAGRFPGTTG